MTRTAVAAILAGAVVASCSDGGGNGGGDLTEVTVAAVTRTTVAETVTASARLEAGREALLFGSGRVIEVAVSEGDTVLPGQTLVSLSGDPAARAGVEAARNGLTAADSELDNARRDLERARRLHRSGGVSSRDLQGAETAVQVSRAARSSALARLESAKASAEASAVVAPFGGAVGRIWAREGALAEEGPLIQVVGEGALRARLLLPREYAGAIRPGAEASFRASGGAFGELSGHVSAVAAGLDPETGLLPVTLVFAGGREVPPGAMGTALVVTRVEEDVLAVPRQALRRTSDCCRVAVVEGGIARVREVTAGLAGGELVEIESGLRAGDRVVTEAAAYPADGESVTVSQER